MSICQQGIVGKQAQRLLINHRQGSCDVRLLGNRQGEAQSSKALEGLLGGGCLSSSPLLPVGPSTRFSFLYTSVWILYSVVLDSA